MSRIHAPGTPRQAAVAFIFITVLLDMLGTRADHSRCCRKLIEIFQGGNTADAARIYGLFGTVWAVMQFFASPFLGALSDRFGRRPVILLSNFGLGLDYVLMALAPSLGWLFVGRVISGITSASVATAFAYIADVTPGETARQGIRPDRRRVRHRLHRRSGDRRAPRQRRIRACPSGWRPRAAC